MGEKETAAQRRAELEAAKAAAKAAKDRRNQKIDNRNGLGKKSK